MKERVTLTIEKNLLKKVDLNVDGSKVKNRSHAVELLLLRAFSSYRPRKAIILAGGVREKSDDSTPKSLTMVKDKTVLEWNIELLRLHGVKEVMLCIANINGQKIKDKFADGANYGLRIYYSEQEHPLGTAGTLKAVSGFITETTIICNADELKNIDLDDMYEFHKDGNKSCTIALTTLEDPSKYGVALMNGSKIITFIEKPPKDNAPSKLVNAGLYIVEPEVLKFIPEGFSTIEQDLFPKLADQEKLFGYMFSGQWYPIKTKYEIAVKEWKGL